MVTYGVIFINSAPVHVVLYLCAMHHPVGLWPHFK